MNIPTDKYHSKISAKAGSLGVVIRTFKAAVTATCCRKGFDGLKWQSGFYEHIIGDDRSLARIRRYVANNPWRRIMDAENPNRQVKDEFGH